MRIPVYKIVVCFMLFAFCLFQGTVRADEKKEFRVGVIGTTTSHVPAFAKLFNDPNAEAPFDRYQITAGYMGGMPDNPDSWNRREEYAQALIDLGGTIYPTIEEMLEHVDFVLLHSVDGRPHLEQAKPVIAAKKPFFIDKPMAGSLADTLEIFRLARENNVPVFSASSLRYSDGFQKMRNEKPLGEILGCVAYSPCSYNEKHPDFFWYGVHGVETLFTLMGSGCDTVTRIHTPDADVAVGVWKDGRIGEFRGTRKGPHGYGAFVFGEKGFSESGKYDGYKPLAVDVCRFFDTGQPSFDPEETIEMFAFMEAADISRQRGGTPVSIKEALDRAKSEFPIYVTISASSNVGTDQFVLINDEKIPVARIAERIKEVKSTKENAVVKVILVAEEGMHIDDVRKITDQLYDAYLANYLYNDQGE